MILFKKHAERLGQICLVLRKRQSASLSDVRAQKIVLQKLCSDAGQHGGRRAQQKDRRRYFRGNDRIKHRT